jgi:nitrite reductase (cytochrome c-552)
MKSESKKRTFSTWIIFGVTVVVVFLLGLLAASIVDRRAEGEFVYKPKASFEPQETRNQVWGINFPREYQSYMKTADTTFRSKYNGSAMIDMLAVDPRLVVLWAGYGFSKDYNQGRGHAYAIKDVVNSLRTGALKSAEDGPMPSTCWTCKSPDVVRVMSEKGVREYYTGTWASLGHEIVNPIGCADCHDPQSMNLRITRPTLIEAFQRQGKDITKVSHQEMRSLVCAQCHVEYYFDKSDKKSNYLTLPWDGGMTMEAMEAYYDNLGFSDWTHALSKAPMLKAQHPDYELYTMGVHADRGVSCADCHMPYKSEGGQKFTDHHIQSPLNNVANSCQVCHREETAKLIANVFERQDKIIENRDKLEELLVRAHTEAKLAWDKGATEQMMSGALTDIRHAQWRWDYAAASHGASFHAPLETSRVISKGIEKAQEARLKLTRVLNALGVVDEVPYPDIDTKEKAQAYIGLPAEKLKADKNEFLKTMLPQWVEAAKVRESGWKVTYL